MLRGKHPNSIANLIRYKGKGSLPQAVREKISLTLKTKGVLPPSRKGTTYVCSPDRRAKISVARKRHIESHGNCRCLGNRHPSKLSQVMVKVFLSEFPMVIVEKQFGPFSVDAYLPPPYHIAFEADGEYWHERRGKDYDEARDAYLLVEHNLPVIRLTEIEIKSAEKLWGPEQR